MSVGSDGYLAGVKFHPNLISGTTYINKKVEQNRRELYEKAEQYGKDYKDIIHGIHRNKRKTRNSSMLEYTEQMKTFQHNRLFIPSQSTVHSYDNRSSLEVRQLPRDRHLPKIARSLDGSSVHFADRTSICSPKSTVSKSCSLPVGSTSKRKSERKNDFRLKFDNIEMDDSVSKCAPRKVNPSEEKAIPRAWASSDPKDSRKVNAFTGNYSGIMRVGDNGNSKGKTVTIKLPVINKDSQTAENGLLLTLEPELVGDKEYESNVSTIDDTSDYELDVPSTSVPIVEEDDEMKVKRREEHTRTLLREAVDKLKEIEDRYKNSPPLVIPKLKKKKRLKLSNNLDSIPEAVSENEKQENNGVHRRRYFASPNMVRTPKTSVVVKPSLDVIPELNSKDTGSNEHSSTQQHHFNRTNAFRGCKLNSRSVTSPNKSSRTTVDWDTQSGISLQSKHKQHIVTAKVEDDFKSKRLQFGSKFCIKYKKIKFLKAY